MLSTDCYLASLYCRSCFPHSPCGTRTGDNFDGPVNSGDEFEDSFETCADDSVASSAACEYGAGICFDTLTGECGFDGELLSDECKLAEPCEACFPHSPCSANYGEYISAAASRGGAMAVAWIAALVATVAATTCR